MESEVARLQRVTTEGEINGQIQNAFKLTVYVSSGLIGIRILSSKVGQSNEGYKHCKT